jgi:DNA-directed RNA polymerase sigma subunit (sigma70/sigma32)
MMGARIPFKPRPADRKALVVLAMENTPTASDGAIARRFGISRERARQIRNDAGLPRRATPETPHVA